MKLWWVRESHPVGRSGAALYSPHSTGNQPVLIFDDSLSAVDMETDILIREALKERSKGITTFIISHRINTLAQADFIIVMDKGRIIQQGTHNELECRWFCMPGYGQFKAQWKWRRRVNCK